MSGYHFSFCFASKKIGLCLQSVAWLSYLQEFLWPSHLVLKLDQLYLHLYWHLYLLRDCWISHKTDLDYWFCCGFSIFLLLCSFLAIFDPWGGHWRLLGALSKLWGPPRASMSSLTSKDTLPRVWCQKNGPWLLILLWFSNFFTLMVIFSHFWSLGGLWGPFRGAA